MSYITSYNVAKRNKPFFDGEFVTHCLVKNAALIFPEKKNDFKNYAFLVVQL